MNKQDFEKAKDIQNKIELLNRRLFNLETATKDNSKSIYLKYTPKIGRGSDEIIFTSADSEMMDKLINTEIEFTKQEIEKLNKTFESL